MTLHRYVILLWLSSILVPAAILFTGPPIVLLSFYTLAVSLDLGHTFSPIAMAWAHSGFRQVMLRHPWKFIALPLVILVLAGTIGAVTSAGWTSFVYQSYNSRRITDLSNPYPILVWTYIVWNFYHFGMQNFGVVSLLRKRQEGWCGRWQRDCDMSWCVWPTAVALVAFGPIVSFNHWIVEIGLCTRVMKGWRRWVFLAAMPALGGIAFIWSIPSSHGTMIRLIPIIISLRLGAGMWHFLQSRWTWRMHDPDARATIGRDLVTA